MLNRDLSFKLQYMQGIIIHWQEKKEEKVKFILTKHSNNLDGLDIIK